MLLWLIDEYSFQSVDIQLMVIPAMVYKNPVMVFPKYLEHLLSTSLKPSKTSLFLLKGKVTT